MQSLKHQTILGVVVLFTAALSSLATWYSVDRVGFIQTACEAGVPNWTKPDRDVGRGLECAVFEEKRVYFGHIRTAQNHVWIYSDDLTEVIRFDGLVEDSALLSCGEDYCWERFEDLPGQVTLEFCGGRTRFSGIRVEGWLTETRHRTPFMIGGHSRFLLLDEIIEGFKPPDGVIEEARPGHERAQELCGDDFDFDL